MSKKIIKTHYKQGTNMSIELHIPAENAATFVKDLTKLLKHCGKEETRFYLKSVNISTDDTGKVRLDATDGYRACRMTLPKTACGSSEPGNNYTVPKEVLEQLCKISKSHKNKENITLHTQGTAVHVNVGAFAWSDDLIDCNYPSIDTIIPKETEVIAVYTPAYLRDFLDTGTKSEASVEILTVKGGCSQKDASICRTPDGSMTCLLMPKKGMTQP